MRGIYKVNRVSALLTRAVARPRVAAAYLWVECRGKSTEVVALRERESSGEVIAVGIVTTSPAKIVREYARSQIVVLEQRKKGCRWNGEGQPSRYRKI